MGVGRGGRAQTIAESSPRLRTTRTDPALLDVSEARLDLSTLAGVKDFRPRAGCFKVGVSNLSVSGNPVSSTAGRFNEQLR